MTGIDNRYEIIYADPPWQYEQSRLSGAAEHHYPTMKIDDICALPVTGISADDSILFMWATYPMLDEALQVIKSWGFTYKTAAFTWIKTNKVQNTPFLGLGFWTRGNAEICLLGTKGKPKRQSCAVPQVVVSPIGKHSEKPDIVRERIVELMGDIPRIELFARNCYDGWDCWGNEVDSDIEITEKVKQCRL